MKCKISLFDGQIIHEDKTNLTLEEFTQILIAFYHLPIRLVMYTHLLIDASKYA